MTSGIVINIFSLLVLAILSVAFKTTGETRTFRGKLLLGVIATASLLLIFSSVLQWFYENPSPRMSGFVALASIVVFCLNPVSGMILALYADYHMEPDPSRTRHFMALARIAALANAVISVTSLYTGWYFRLEDGYRYSRGPLYPLVVLVAITPPILVLGRLFARRRTINPDLRTVLVTYIAIPLVSGIVQVFMPEWRITWGGYVLSILIMFIYIQGNAINVDFLTGTGNLRTLENALLSIGIAGKKRKTAGVFMFDIDDLGQTNASLGHEAGDDLLVQFAAILRSVFPLPTAIARFGGDEFAVVTRDVNGNDCLALAEAVMRGIRDFNLAGMKPYRLSVSSDWGVYDPAGGIGPVDFLHNVDRRMYMDRQKRKSAL